MISPKQIATFLLGAAAGYGLYKYKNMSAAEKEQLKSDLKAKAEQLSKETKTFFDDLFNKKKSRPDDRNTTSI
jgi:hypothetical protein